MESPDLDPKLIPPRELREWLTGLSREEILRLEGKVTIAAAENVTAAALRCRGGVDKAV